MRGISKFFDEAAKATAGAGGAVSAVILSGHMPTWGLAGFVACMCIGFVVATVVARRIEKGGGR